MFRLTGCVLPKKHTILPSKYYSDLDLTSLPLKVSSPITEVGAVKSSFVDDEGNLCIECFVDASTPAGEAAVSNILTSGHSNGLVLEITLEVKLLDNTYVQMHRLVAVWIGTSIYKECRVVKIEKITTLADECMTCGDFATIIPKRCQRCMGIVCMLHREDIQTIAGRLMCQKCAEKNQFNIEWIEAMLTRLNLLKIEDAEAEV